MSRLVCGYKWKGSFESQPPSNWSLVKGDDSFQLYSIDEEIFVYLKEGISLVITCDSIDQQFVFLEKYFPTVENLPLEKLLVVEGEEEANIEYESVRLPHLTNDHVHLLSLNMAQSIAIDEYKKRILEMSKMTSSVSRGLSSKGRVLLSRTQLRKAMGDAIQIQTEVMQSLFVYDAPDVAWEDENLIQINQELKEVYHIESRHEGLQQKMSIIKESFDLFKDILQHKHSSMLEWIIIILILFEVVHLIFEQL